MKDKKMHCLNCGAPVTTEICPYCHSVTGLNTADAVMEYPVIDCKEANISFWNFFFPMIFAISFGFFGFVFPFIFLLSDEGVFLEVALFCSIFGIISIIALVIAVKTLIKYLIIKTKGKEIDAVVYGYMDDNFIINGNPAKIVKLLVNTNDGQKFILYQLGEIKQLYKVNSKIKLKVYKNIFYIIKNSKHYF